MRCFPCTADTAAAPVSKVKTISSSHTGSRGGCSVFVTSGMLTAAGGGMLGSGSPGDSATTSAENIPLSSPPASGPAIPRPGCLNANASNTPCRHSDPTSAIARAQVIPS